MKGALVALILLSACTERAPADDQGAELTQAVRPFAAPKTETKGSGSGFVPVDVGIEHLAFSEDGDKASAYSGHAFKIDLDKAGLRALAAGAPTQAREASVIARSLPRALAINASFFDKEGRAMGLVVDEGRTLNKSRLTRWSALVVDKGRASIVKGDKIPAAPTLVVQGQPRFLINGQVPKLKAQSARRTVVCAEGKEVIFVVTTSVDASKLARFLKRPRSKGGLGCTNALNLDGGPSTQLSARLRDKTLEVAGGWGVPNALVAIPGLTKGP